MPDEITLRHLGPDDLRLLLSVEDGLFDNTIDPIEAKAFLDDPMNWLVLSFDGDLAVGMGSATILRHPDKKPSLFINEIGVRESHQRRGIGKQVTQALIDKARQSGVHGVWLGTETDNVAALALYRSLDADEVEGVYFGWDDAL